MIAADRRRLISRRLSGFNYRQVARRQFTIGLPRPRWQPNSVRNRYSRTLGKCRAFRAQTRRGASLVRETAAECRRATLSAATLISSPRGSPAILGAQRSVNYDTPSSRRASPAAARLARRISEYLRERMTPEAPEMSAAFTAAFTSVGWVFFWSFPVGISMSMPG